MQIEQLLPLDEVATAVDAGRRSLSRIDLSGIPSATMAAARDTLPGPWSRPKPRLRWPLVGFLLVLGTAVAGLMLIAPALRRRVTAETASDPTPDALAFDPDSAGALPLDGIANLADLPLSAR